MTGPAWYVLRIGAPPFHFYVTGMCYMPRPFPFLATSAQLDQARRYRVKLQSLHDLARESWPHLAVEWVPV